MSQTSSTAGKLLRGQLYTIGLLLFPETSAEIQDSSVT